MKQIQVAGFMFVAAISVAGYSFVNTLPLRAAPGTIFAQKLVQEQLLKHPEIEGLEIAAYAKSSCQTIAATNPKDLGEKCDKDELGPLRTGEPFVEREGDGFDLTLPLHDRSKQIIAVVGIDFKPAPGQTTESVTKQGRQIVAEMEAQVPTKEKLFEPQS